MPATRVRVSFVLTFAFLPLKVAAQVAVSPLVIVRDSAEVVVTNVNAFPVRVALSLMDFDQAGDGRTELRPLGSSPGSCGGRVSVGPLFTQLQAREERRVAVRVEPAAAACWQMLVIEASRTAAPGARIGVKLYDPGATAGAAEVSEIGALQGRTGERYLRLVLRNTGSRPLRASAVVEFRDASGAVVGRGLVPEFGAHPGVAREVTVEMPRTLPGGQFVVLAVFDAGLDALIAGQQLVDVPPPAGEQ